MLGRESAVINFLKVTANFRIFLVSAIGRIKCYHFDLEENDFHRYPMFLVVLHIFKIHYLMDQSHFKKLISVLSISVGILKILITFIIY